ncbi:MAG: response regulator transcription factor [Bacteroidota bacterium]
MKLLIIEDNQELAENTLRYLGAEGYVCEHAANLRDALSKLYGYSYDIVVLDLMLPDGDGLDILRSIKENWPDYGVLIISAKNALDDKLAGLEMGADDYLSKPFHLAELNARLKAIYRRRHQQGEDRLEFEEIALDMQSHEAYVKDQQLDLTRKEYELLQYFIVNKNRLLTKQSIAEHLWGDYMDTADSFDFVYQHIKNLRKKIMHAGGNDYLQTVYGAGYKMKVE